ncbi:MAG: efflux RND transporter periplasmic adaptor subunit [Rikenellaceae bacterium]|nr:efflux RND transporter periplasmic adaptor subunit [Rikenellaceae bacterium]
MNIKHLTLLAAAAMFAACGGRNNTAHEHEHDHQGHTHTTHTHEAHSHEGHTHDEHNHQGHNHTEHETHAEHSHEGHNHNAHEGHEGHDHGAEAHADGEIVFSAEQAEAAGLQTEVLKAADFAEIIATSGVVESAPTNRTAVVAPAAGVLTLRNIYVGSRVHKGQVLATLSGRRIAEGDPAEQVRIDYELARKEWERAGRLVEQKIISEQEYDRLTSTYESARRRYEALASEEGEGIVVKSPVDGYIVACDAANGDYVQTGKALFTITAGNRMTLTADLPVGKTNLLSDIVSANFMLPYSDKVYSMAELGGRIEAVGRCADGAAYLPVTFVFNAPAEVLSGTFAEVWLVGRTESDIVSVPKEALTEEQGLHFVYVRLDSECYRKQEVRTVATDGRRVAIEGTDLEGLEIVTRGVYQVKLAANASIIPEGHSHNH